MLKSSRPLVVAAALCVLMQAAAASAQTAITRKVPAGSTVELVLNAAKVGTATADAAGDAKIPFTVPQSGDGNEMDAYIHVDACADLTRVIVVERNQTPPVPEAGCTRRDVSGLFLIKKVTNLVVDTSPANPTVWLRQGSVDLNAKPKAHSWDDMPTGLIAFGGAGLGRYRDSLDNQCGNSTVCEGNDSHTTYIAGGTFWLGPFIGLEGAWLKPAGVNANGGAQNHHFNSVFSSSIWVINGKAGIPAGKVRVYGQGGTNYGRGKQATTETIDNVGTQVIEIKTGGWGWQFGGGLEVWVKSKIGVFGEVNRVRVQGDGLEGSNGRVEDYFDNVLVGMRFKVGR